MICVGATANAHANPLSKYKPKTAKGKQYFKLGNTFLGRGDYQLAIKAYKDGYLIDTAPIFIFNLAAVHKEMGKLKESIAYYKRFLLFARDPHPVVRDNIQKMIKQLSAKLAEQERAKADKAKKDRARKKPKALTSLPLPKRKPRAPALWYSDKVGWGTSAGGIVVAGVGVGLLANASSLRDDADQEIDFARRKQLRDSADARQTWGIVLGITGAVALTVGVIKLIVHNKRRAGSERAVNVALGPDRVGVRGSF